MIDRDPLPPSHHKAFLIYEDELTDSKAQIRALCSMVGTLLRTRNLEDNDYDALATKTTQYAAKLLKKPDQCRMVAMCSHLFFVGAEVRGMVGGLALWPMGVDLRTS